MKQNQSAIFGFTQIPNFSKYHINRDGTIYNTATGHYMYGNKSKQGYVYFNLVSDVVYEGKALIRRMSRHRLLAICFIPSSRDITNLYVNHINGIKGDDRLDNLEWVTPRENVEHAGALNITDKCIPISVKDYTTGKIRKYKSATSASKELGITKDQILHRIKKGEEYVFPEGNQYRKGHSSDTWYSPDINDRQYFPRTSMRPVLVKNLLSNTIKEFQQLSDAADYIGFALSSTATRIYQRPQSILPGYYIMKFSDDPTPWRDVQDPYLEMDNESGSRSVVVIDEEGEKKIFETCAKCAEAYGLKTTTLNFRLKANGNSKYGGLVFRYYSDYVKDCPT